MPKIELNPARVCRLCMGTHFIKRFVNIFNSDFNYADVIQDYAKINISPNDGLPQILCSKCATKTKTLKNFVMKCIKVDRKLRNVPDNKIEEIFLISDIKQEIKIENYIEPTVLVSREPPPLIKINYFEARPETQTNVEQLNKSDSDSEDDDQINDDSDRELNDAVQQNESKNLIPMEKVPTKKLKKKYIYNRKSPCDICGKSYKKTDMKYHSNKHLGLFPYICTVGECDKKFVSPNKLKKHHLFIHSNVRKFKCDECGSCFKTTMCLKYHKSYHRDPTIPCTVCSSMVRNQRDLRKHMMSHTKERPYPCTVCPKAFANNYNLKVHSRIHTGEKPFSCEKCGDAFGYNSLLKAHKEKYHPVN